MVLLPALPLLLAGCATSALWREGQFASFHEPATPSNLALYQSATNREVLVGFDELGERDNAIRRRYYWVNPDHAPFKNPHQPKFVPEGERMRLTPIPIVAGPIAQPLTNAPFGVCTNGQEFTLFVGAKESGPFQLPVYDDGSGRTKQVLLTPVTVVADVTVIGGFLFLLAWSEGALSDVH